MRCAAPLPLAASVARISYPNLSLFASDRSILEPRALASGGEGGALACGTSAGIMWKAADAQEPACAVEGATRRRKGRLVDVRRPWRSAVGRTSAGGYLRRG